MISPQNLTLLLCAVFLACQTSTKEEKFHSSQCRIIGIQDSTISEHDKIVQFNFVCGDGALVKEFNLLNENPWKGLDFPVVTPTSGLISTSNFHEKEKKGHLWFDLNNLPLGQIKSTLPHTIREGIDHYFSSMVSSICTYRNYSPTYLIVNYWSGLYGMIDTTHKKDLRVLASADELKIFAANGEVAYHLSSAEFSYHDTRIDTATDVLYFQTYKPDGKLAITGIEIHDLQHDTLLFRVVCDTSLFIQIPQPYQVNEYLAFPVLDIMHDLKEIYLFKLDSKKLFRKEMDHQFPFSGAIISAPYLILCYYPGEEETVYDTLKIDEFELFR